MIRINKRYIVAALLLAVVIASLWFLHERDNDTNGSVDEAAATKTTEVSPEIDSVNEVGSEEQQPNPSPEELLEASKKLQKTKQMQQASNRDINFYGQIVDQFGDPVSNAEIRYSYAHYPDIVLPTFSWSTETGEARSDGDGRFEIIGKNGVHLTIEHLRHPDYKIRSHNTFHFRPRSVGDVPFTSDPVNPVIFRAWKKGYAATMLKSGHDYWAYRTDGKYYKVPMEGLGSDLQVQFELLDPVDQKNDNRQWRATLRFDNGGLVETTDTFMYKAPESGYQTEWTITAGENYRVKKQFYFMAKGGQVYGRITMTLRGYYGDRVDNRNKGFIDYQYTLNPTGSRNLLSEND